MAGYQGWFTAEGDGSGRGWYHYRGASGFMPGSVSVDFLPDMTEYSKKYETGFSYPSGEKAFVYSACDEETIDLHFKWMQEYNIDGVFMQRFVGEIRNPAGRKHFNTVLKHALKAAKKYNRAICIMYDLSGYKPEYIDLVEKDWQELQQSFSLLDPAVNPTYLNHNKKPLLALWGVGFSGRKYTTNDIQQLITRIKSKGNEPSILLGVPYHWRTLSRDAENNPMLHELIRHADVIMPWAVNRYKMQTYTTEVMEKDIAWCKKNKVDYAPLVFPGFSWGNLKRNTSIYNENPRCQGDFLWKQIAGAVSSGAKMLYVAMFDEMDEGTAIFKCAREGQLPLNGEGKFIGIEENLPTDYYLWLTGKGSEWIKKTKKYDSHKPQRYSRDVARHVSTEENH
jgi:hypothetical protein